MFVLPLPGGEVLALIDRALHHHEPLLGEMIGGCRAELRGDCAGPCMDCRCRIWEQRRQRKTWSLCACLSCVLCVLSQTLSLSQQFHVRHCPSLLRTNPRAFSEPMSVLHVQDVSDMLEHALGNLIVKCGNPRNWMEDKIPKPRGRCGGRGSPRERRPSERLESETPPPRFSGWQTLLHLLPSPPHPDPTTHPHPRSCWSTVCVNAVAHRCPFASDDTTTHGSLHAASQNPRTPEPPKASVQGPKVPRSGIAR
ncbi:hypothetical protein F5144DRAFT_234371 [Chaetomium tenue]|uniref:Uncharacterized protein n=1 Tax=Chaetomium tenue TaxID=1854479 RepID=A0ACB7P6S1_9PEZI|nr:hypothetical protein F5144DRAFT_234371 [Chaetomium globosum]